MKFQKAVLTDLLTDRDRAAIGEMDPHERLFTVRGYGTRSLKPAKFNTLFSHTVTWACKLHDVPDCMQPMETGGTFTFLSPVRHDPDMLSVGLLCPRCGEAIGVVDGEESLVHVYLSITPLEHSDITSVEPDIGPSRAIN